MTNEHKQQHTPGAMRAAGRWLGRGLDVIEHDIPLLTLARIIDEETATRDLLVACQGLRRELDCEVLEKSRYDDVMEFSRAAIAAATKEG